MDILTLAIAKSKSGSPNGTITTENITNANYIHSMLSLTGITSITRI